jgi:CRISPR-associated protein Cmr2
MTRAVLVMSIGPVQDFIAQARRSRDLWFGSHVLSEVSRAAAKAAAQHTGVELVFPALSKDDAELAPCDAAVRTTGKPPLNVGNHLLAVVPAANATTVARLMRQAAQERWLALAAKARGEASQLGLLADGIDAVWNEQIGSLLEVAAASAPFTTPEGYAAARQAAERALAARKNLRDFAPWEHDRIGAPKSSFDGGRVSVLTSKRAAINKRSLRVVRLGSGEQLDAVGIVKRLGGDPDQFVPLANVALADWIERARQEAPEELAGLATACGEGVGRVCRPDLPWTQWGDGRSFDAEVLLEGRLPGVLMECGIADRLGSPEVRDWRIAHLDPLYKKIKPPSVPAVCCLVADGDNMGRAIADIGDPEKHRALSRCLASFASKAQDILARHRGFAVYTGGDDVLGFLAPAHAPHAAAALHSAFAEAMASLEFVTTSPTLSVGLGIGHILDGMAHLLALGRRAERLAKQGRPGDSRDSLAVIVDRRSGGEASWCDKWRHDPVGRIGNLAAAWGDSLPAGKVHEIRAMVARLPRPESAGDQSFSAVLRGEVCRILGRANLGESEGRIGPNNVGLELPQSLPYAEAHSRVSAWLQLALVAREFAAKGRE